MLSCRISWSVFAQCRVLARTWDAGFCQALGFRLGGLHSKSPPEEANTSARRAHPTRTTLKAGRHVSRQGGPRSLRAGGPAHILPRCTLAFEAKTIRVYIYIYTYIYIYIYILYVYVYNNVYMYIYIYMCHVITGLAACYRRRIWKTAGLSHKPWLR